MLQTGDAAPQFRLASDTGEMLGLDDFKGVRLVLFFYPRDNTSG